MSGRIVHCKKEPYDVYIGRPEKWGNPFVIGEHGTRDFVIIKYKLWLNTRPDLLRDIPTLKGKTLGCWCENTACHGEVLITLSESRYVSNWFSNMLPLEHPFVYQNIKFNTVENFYQAMKMPKDRADLRAEIAAMGPYKAKKSIRNKEKYLWDEGWTKEKSLQVMEYALRQKFHPGTFWYQFLMLTEDWEITEWNNWNDTFWGKDLKTEQGENHLGKILMRIRDGYRENI